MEIWIQFTQRRQYRGFYGTWGMIFEWTLIAEQLGPAYLGWPCIGVAELGEKKSFAEKCKHTHEQYNL